MATIGTENLTLADWQQMLDPNGKIAPMINMVTKLKPELSDVVVKEGNLPTGNKVNILAGLPEPTWRKLNYGVKNSKGKRVTVTDTLGMLEDYGEVDKSLADLNGNTNEFLLSENSAHIEGMGQGMAETIFYGDITVHPERFMGLAPRYNQLSGADTSENVIDGGGTGVNLTSIYIVTWGNQQTYLFSPKGQKVGMKVKNLGEVTLYDENGHKYQGYRTHYKWDAGLTVADWRYNVRIANIDVDTLNATATGSSADLIDLLDDAIMRVHNLDVGKPMIYMNRKVAGFLNRQAKNNGNVRLSIDEVAGKKMRTYFGVPIRITDTIITGEAKVN